MGTSPLCGFVPRAHARLTPAHASYVAQTQTPNASEGLAPPQPGGSSHGGAVIPHLDLICSNPPDPAVCGVFSFQRLGDA